MQPKVYVASRASIPARAQMWRALRGAGAKIVSTWIDEDGEGQTDCFGELWARIEAEIRMSDRLVLYVEQDDFPLKGALVEVGMALAMGRPVYVVAPSVAIDSRSWRPLGSWAAHPLVQIVGAQGLLTVVGVPRLPGGGYQGAAVGSARGLRSDHGNFENAGVRPAEQAQA